MKHSYYWLIAAVFVGVLLALSIFQFLYRILSFLVLVGVLVLIYLAVARIRRALSK